MEEERKSSRQNSGMNDLKPKNTEAIINFEHQMEWASFVSAKVLCIHDAAKIEIMSLLTNGQKSIPLSLLLGTPLIAPKFRNEFLKELNTYFKELSNQAYTKGDNEVIFSKHNMEEDTPPRPRKKKRMPDDIIDQCINSLMQKNQTELYFPCGLSFLGEYQLHSTAKMYTISNNDKNVFCRFKSLKVSNKDKSYAKKVKLEDAYLLHQANIIIARPLVVGKELNEFIRAL